MKLGPLLTVGCYAGWNGRVHEMEGNFTHLFCLIFITLSFRGLFPKDIQKLRTF